jgi:hypothetical protein
MKLDALDHPKTLDFAARLNVTRPTAIGHLELLWAFTGKQAARGNIGKWPNGAIARACDWMGDPEVFISSLVESKLLDQNEEHRLSIHDWSVHAPGWVRAKLKKLGEGFVGSSDGSLVATQVPIDDIPEATSEASSRARASPSVVKSNEEKGREGTKTPVASEMAEALAEARARPGLNLEAFDIWVEYRKKIKRAIKAISVTDAAEALIAFGDFDRQMAVVRHSKSNGYIGLYAPKDNLGGSVSRSEPIKLRTAEEWDALERTQEVSNG